MRKLFPTLQDERVYVGKPNITLEQFQLSRMEKMQFDNFTIDMFTYTLQWKAFSTCDNGIIDDYRTFLELNPNVPSEPSKIHYLELLNEHADSDSAMLQVVEDLLEKFNFKSGSF